MMNFYLLDEPLTHGKYALTTTPKHRGNKVINCSVCGMRAMIGKKALGKVPVELLVKDILTDREEPEDICYASTVPLASRRFREAVAEAGLTGIAFYLVVGYQLRNDNKLFKETLRRFRDEADYQVLHVNGSGGSIAETSGVQLVKSCDACGWIEWSLPENGIYLDESQWDGSDFIHVKEYGDFFMSQRAVDALSQAGLNNFGYKPIESIKSPFPTE